MMRVADLWLREDAPADLAAYQKASAILGRLIRFMVHGNPEQHYGFKAFRFNDGLTCLTLRGSDLGLSGMDATLWFWFTTQEGYATHGSFSRLKTSREPVIIVRCLADLTDTDDAAKKIIYSHPVHDVLLHELVHYLDSQRDPHLNPVDDATVAHPETAKDSPAYYNAAHEFNAFFTNFAEPLLRVLHAADAAVDDVDPATLRRMAQATGLDGDFQATLETLVTRAKGKANPALIKFYRALRKGRKRALLRRLYALHQQVLAVLGRADAAILPEGRRTPLTESVTKRPWGFYHGTSSPSFDRFEPAHASKGRQFWNPLGHGLYCTDSPDFAHQFGPQVHKVLIPAGATYRRITPLQWITLGQFLVLKALAQAMRKVGVDFRAYDKGVPEARPDLRRMSHDDLLNAILAHDFAGAAPATEIERYQQVGGAMSDEQLRQYLTTRLRVRRTRDREKEDKLFHFKVEAHKLLRTLSPYESLFEIASMIDMDFGSEIGDAFHACLPDLANKTFSRYDFVVFTETNDVIGMGKNGKSALEVVVFNPAMQRTVAG